MEGETRNQGSRNQVSSKKKKEQSDPRRVKDVMVETMLLNLQIP